VPLWRFATVACTLVNLPCKGVPVHAAAVYLTETPGFFAAGRIVLSEQTLPGELVVFSAENALLV